ncbi:MAG: hypothetical protein KatS3mg108_0439 [Isosphaeraceae bacterium]|jgi:hypothetical protein|nr:MAG: hypothetical protein KatS3mg108_0439 [Isosphaeraceae bacterium]
MVRFPKPGAGSSSPLRAKRARPRRAAPLFAPEDLERKFSPSAYVTSLPSNDPDAPNPDDYPGYPLPYPPLPPGGPNGPA